MRESTPVIERGAAWRGWLGLLIGFGLLFGLTASRSILWQDSGQFVLRVATGELDNHFGLALVHPLQYWLAYAATWTLPVEPPLAASLVTAVFGAVTVANVFGITLTLTGRPAAAILTAVALGVAHTFWRQSTIPESYTITTALLTAELWCLILLMRTRQDRWLLGMLLASGLGFANHNLALLTLPVIGLVMLHTCWQRGGLAGAGLFASAAALWLLGSLPYTGLVALEMARTGEVGATIHSALFGTQFASNVLNLTPSPGTLAISTAFTLLSFPHLFLPAALYGMWRARSVGVHGVVYAALLVALAMHLLFVIRYSVIDQHTFFLPVYTLLAIFAGVGFAAVLGWPVRARRAVVVVMMVMLSLTPLLYAVAPELARRGAVLGELGREKPYRDDYRYLFWPWSVAEVSAERMSRHALALAGTDGLIVGEDNMGLFALAYQRWRMERDGVTIVPAYDQRRRADEPLLDAAVARTMMAAGRPVVLVPRVADEPATPAPVGRWQREGDLYLLVDDVD